MFLKVVRIFVILVILFSYLPIVHMISAQMKTMLTM